MLFLVLNMVSVVRISPCQIPSTPAPPKKKKISIPPTPFNFMLFGKPCQLRPLPKTLMTASEVINSTMCNFNLVFGFLLFSLSTKCSKVLPLNPCFEESVSIINNLRLIGSTDYKDN